MGKGNDSFNSLLAIFICFVILSCAHAPDVVGKWQEVGKTATLEFFGGGAFKAVDNQGMAVRGKYAISPDGNIRFEIDRRGKPPEIVTGEISLQGDELTLISEDGKEVDRYRRERG